jgi:cytochrome c554/c'-like protein
MWRNSIPRQAASGLRCAWVLLLLFGLTVLKVEAQTSNSCVSCHASQSGVLKRAVEESERGVHSHKGMSCDTCHGGNPAEVDAVKAHGTGFRGHIKREEVPQLCGSCHADASHIKQFNPSLRTDQFAQYQTSVHGVKFAAGDTHVAVCTDCHGVHDIRPASDPQSPVHPLNVATTCSRCHSDVSLMKSYRLRATQVADYTESVHHEAMTARGDLSAPTCSTCHGSHGAVPPGAASIVNVCATCHVVQAQAFEQSPHKTEFAEGCTTCHSAHKIKRPDDHFVGLAKGASCADCHAADEESGKQAALIHDHLVSYEDRVAKAAVAIDKAAHSGLDVSNTQVEISQAMDSLTKARVRVHTARAAAVDSELDAGSKILARAERQGEDAMRERNARRKGLLIPVLAMAAVVFSLGAYIRDLERGDASKTNARTKDQ